MKRTILQRHNKAMNRANKAYRNWMTAPAGSPCARRAHTKYNKYLDYLHALEQAHPYGT